MYNVSNAYKTAMASNVQHHRVTGTIGGISFSDENILKGSLSITNQCSDNSSVQIGQVYIGELNLTLRNLELSRYTIIGKTITPYFGLKLSDSTWEDIPLGVFKVASAEWTRSGIVIKAYDRMAALDESCSITSAIGLPYVLAGMACTACGVTLHTTSAEFNAFPNGDTSLSLYTENDIETWRDFLSWLAQSLSCNVMADRTGGIIFKSYSQVVTDTLDPSHRFSGASFSDFETRYTGVSCTNIGDKTTSYYGLAVDDALTYNLGSNPFLQYGVSEEVETLRRAVLTGLQSIDYVPFKVSLIGNPAYDLMDVFAFPGGLGDGNKKFCMTKYAWVYKGSYTATGVGEDPSLSTARSKTDKDITGLLHASTDEGVKYTVYNNAADINVNDGQNISILSLRFAVAKTSHVEMHLEALIEVETTESSVSSAYTENDCTLELTYYMNGVEVTTYHPVEIFQDGNHVLHLVHMFMSAEATVHVLDVWVKCSGGSILIPKEKLFCILSGAGLAGDGTWNGMISVTDTVDPISPDFLSVFTDTANVSTHTPTPATAADIIPGITLSNMLLGFTDAITASTNLMIFSTTVNANLVTTDCTVSGNNWVGTGAVVTADVNGCDHISLSSSNASFLASFDEGSTWEGYNGSTWVEDFEMSVSQLQEADWSGKTLIRLKVILGSSSATCGAITIYGGTLC